MLVARNYPLDFPDKMLRPELFPTASGLRYWGFNLNISAQRSWEKVLALTFCRESQEDNFLWLTWSLKITLAPCNEDSLINYWILAVVFSEIKITPNQVCDMGRDTCDDLTRSGNCPPPMANRRMRNTMGYQSGECLAAVTSDSSEYLDDKPVRLVVGLQYPAVNGDPIGMSSSAMRVQLEAHT